MSSVHQTIYNQVRTTVNRALVQKHNEVLPPHLTSIYGKIRRVTDASIKDSVYAALVVATENDFDAGQWG